MVSQIQLGETIRDVKTLHNENFVAVAQKKYTYIYDNHGAEARLFADAKTHCSVVLCCALPCLQSFA